MISLDSSFKNPINFVEMSGQINQNLLKSEIDRRISKIKFMCSFDLRDIYQSSADKPKNSQSETQTQNMEVQNSNISHPSTTKFSKTETQEELSIALQIDFSNIKRTESLMATYENLNKIQFNTQRNTIQENPEREKSENSDNQKNQIQISRDSKFFSDSNIQLEHFIRTSNTKRGDQNNDSKCCQTEDTNTNNIFQNMSMKSSMNAPENQIVTPMKNLLNDSLVRNSILKSSVKCAKNLFDSSNKKSHLITSFIDQQCLQKRDVLNSFSKQMKRSYCAGCSSKGSRRFCLKSSRKGTEKIYVTDSCKQNMKEVVREFASKLRKETNCDNKVRQNLLKRIFENNTDTIV